jgi:hypothetical protein
VADLSDVTLYLAQQAEAAVYPNGTSGGVKSVAGIDCRVYQGWPIGAQLDLDIAGMLKDPVTGIEGPRAGGVCANVSVFPMLGTGVQVYQIQNKTYTIVPPAINMTFTLSGDTITVSGQPATGEYLTVIADDKYIYSTSGANAAAILSALATAAQANYPGASATATTLTIPVGHSIVVRQGGIATQGRVTHRQKHSVMVTVWAPNRVTRDALASSIDNLIKQSIRVSMPDTSQAIVIYNRTIVNDEQQAESIYRRDLIFDVEYATIQQWTAYVITSTQVSLATPNNTAIATAIT